MSLGIVRGFNARPRDESLDGEIFYSLKVAQIVIESWRRHYKAVRPHESLGYRPPAPEVFVPALAAWPSARLVSAPAVTLSQPSIAARVIEQLVARGPLPMRQIIDESTRCRSFTSAQHAVST